jgi:hypothetical protein
MADQNPDVTSDDDEGATPEPVSRTPAPKPADARPGSGQPARPRKPEVDELPDDPAVLREHIRRERERNAQLGRENAERRAREAEAEKAAEEARVAAMSETDRLRRSESINAKRAEEAERRAAEAEQRHLESQVDIAIERAAHGTFEYPDTVPRLIDRRKITIDEETGEILGVKEAVAKLAKDKPGLTFAKRGGGTPPRDGDYRRAGQPQRPPAGDDYRPTPLDHLRAGGDYSM